MRVFVSYHSLDRVIAERLAAALRAQGDSVEVFLDQWALRPSALICSRSSVVVPAR